jgi:hypothetical protein
VRGASGEICRLFEFAVMKSFHVVYFYYRHSYCSIMQLRRLDNRTLIGKLVQLVKCFFYSDSL